MLAADKLLLRSTVKQRTIELREKELNLFNSNFSAVATQAALLAGFSMVCLAIRPEPLRALQTQRERVCRRALRVLRARPRSGIP